MSLNPRVCKKNYKVHIPMMGENCEFWLVTVTDKESIQDPDRDHAYLTDDNSLYVFNGKELVLVGFEHIYTTEQDLDEFIPDYDDCEDCPSSDLSSIEKLAIKETTQGNPIIISDSADWRLQKLNVYGQSEQEVKEQVQLIPPFAQDDISKTLNIVYESNKSSACILTRKAGVNQYKFCYVDIDLKAGTYYLKYSSLTGEFLGGNLIKLEIISDESDLVILTDKNKKKQFTISKDEKVRLKINSGNTIEGKAEINGLMLSRNDVPWEPYVKQSLNLFDKSKLEKLKTINTDGSIVANGSSNVSGYISVKPNTKYSMTGTKQTRGKFYTSDKKGIGTDYNFNPYDDTTFETDANTHFIQFCLGSSNDGSNVMLNEGTSLLPYEEFTGNIGNPSPNNPIPIISKKIKEIKITGMNLFDPNDIKDSVTNGSTTITNNHDGSFTFTGTFAKIINLMNKNKVLLKKGTYRAYSNRSNNNNNLFYMINASGTYITANLESGRLFTLEQDTYCDIYIQCGGTFTEGETIKPFIYMGEDIKPYEPYKEQKIAFTDPITLRGIPVKSGGNVIIDEQQYVADVICEKDGVVGVERRTLLLKPKEGIVVNFRRDAVVDTDTRYYQRAFFDKTATMATTKMSNYFVYVAWGNTSAYGKYTFDIGKDELYVSTPTLKSKEEIDEMMNKIIHDLEFVVQCEPTFEPLPEEIQTQYKALKSYYPNTVIQTGAFNEVEYVADTKMYIDKKLEEVNTSLLETQNAILKGV